MPSRDVETYNFGQTVNRNVITQILEMDGDDSDRAFSRELVDQFFTAAYPSFDDLNKAIESRDLHTLDLRGHLLKGHANTLGFIRFQELMTNIHHYGRQEDETGKADVYDEDKCLELARKAVSEAEKEYHVLRGVMGLFYGA